MIRYFFASVLILANLTTLAQTDVHTLLSKADSAYFDFKDYKTALRLYKSIRGNLKEVDADYSYTVDKIAKSLFYCQYDEHQIGNYQSSLMLSKELLDMLDRDKKYLDTSLDSKKYWLYKNMVMGYFSMGELQKAKVFQDLLYKAYKNQTLPEGIDKYYCFEKFVYKGMNVWGYEWYPQLGDKETEGSFSKHVYYIYTRDDKGNDKEQQYTLHTVKIHKLNGNEPDYVLTKRFSTNEQEISESIWTFTFSNPIDYSQLQHAVKQYMDGGI
ncbi:MAG: hypothetical protein JNL13_12280 [Chitinophagaceae bacterium]|nr:hypothetical protein [Chitinophagaceae bacterium]